MTSVFNKELSPWEKKPSFFRNVRFGYLEDIQKNIDALKDGIHTQNEVWLKSAGSAFVHPDRMPEALNFFQIDEADITEGVSGLKASFEWGISDVLWLIEQQGKELQNLIMEHAKNENATSAKLRSNAQNAYSKGWFEEALKDFLKVEKRESADFSVFVSIGMIYLFHQVNKERAFDYFQKAEKWIKSKSSFYLSFALIYLGLIQRDLGKMEEAENLSKTAVDHSPNFSVAIYQNALHNAILGREERALKMLKKAGNLDPRYFLKALSDEAFKPFAGKINKIIEETKKLKRSAIEKTYRQITEVVNEIHQLTREFNEKYKSKPISIDKETLTVIEGGLEEFKISLSNDTLMGYAFIDQLIGNSNFSRMVKRAHKKVYNNIMAKRKEFIKPFEQKIQQVRSRCNLFSSENGSGMGQTIVALFYVFFGACGAVIASFVNASLPSAIVGAIGGFAFGLGIQFCIKRYGDTYEIDYSVYDTYNEIESFLVNLKNLEKKLPKSSVQTI